MMQHCIKSLFVFLSKMSLFCVVLRGSLLFRVVPRGTKAAVCVCVYVYIHTQTHTHTHTHTQAVDKHEHHRTVGQAHAPLGSHPALTHIRTNTQARTYHLSSLAGPKKGDFGTSYSSAVCLCVCVCLDYITWSSWPAKTDSPGFFLLSALWYWGGLTWLRMCSVFIEYDLYL